MKTKCFILSAFLFGIIWLSLSGCNIPEAATLRETSFAETAIAAYVETAEAVKPSAAPTPTTTPLPTFTLQPSPTSTSATVLTATPTLGPEYFHGTLWYETGFVSQEGLRYNGKLINTGCTAASVQMVLDFWHAYKEEYPTLKAQTLIDQNTWQRQFHEKTGLNIMDTEDDLNALGYYLGIRQDSSKEELIAALERYGPLLVLTKVNWTPFGANHMAVVTGYLPEKDIIRVLDPWQIGGIMEFPFENFDGIWSLNYLDDETETLQRTFFFIVPYAEISKERSNELFIPYRDLQLIRETN